MKSTNSIIPLFGVLLLTSAAIAAEPAANHPEKDHPCRALRKSAIDACTSAKFEKGQHQEHKGLFKDCVRPIMEGQTVTGVTVDAELVKACQSRQAARETKAPTTAH